MSRDKRDCMKLGTCICPRSEVWEDSAEQCDDCPHYISKEGERDKGA